jgi:hypothetical protein
MDKSRLFIVFDLLLSVFINVHTRSVLISRASLRLLQRGRGDSAVQIGIQVRCLAASAGRRRAASAGRRRAIAR